MRETMTGDEYARALKRLGFSNRGFCLTVIDVNDATGRRWISGDAPVPGSVACFLRLALAMKLDAEGIKRALKL
jgi:hypothetical protein